MDSVSKMKLREGLIISRQLLEHVATIRCKRAELCPFPFNGQKAASHSSQKTKDSDKAPNIIIKEITHKTRIQQRQALPDSKIQSE